MSGKPYAQSGRVDQPAPSFVPITRGLLRRAAAGHSEPTTVPPIVPEVLASNGQALDPDTRVEMESRFGHDFGQVRVHIDAQAAESAEAVNALAYTVGEDVVFGAGQYTPETSVGQRLLAHELTHVVQQAGPVASTSSAEALSIDAPSSPHEQAAEQVADVMAADRHPVPVPGAPAGISEMPSSAGVSIRPAMPHVQRQQKPGTPNIPEMRPAGPFVVHGFGLGQTGLTSAQQAQLRKIAANLLAELAAHPNATIEVVGHTDTVGTEERNKVVGDGRATSVIAFLAAQKVPTQNMRAHNRESSEPAIKTGPNVSEPRNRRVEISFTEQSAPSQPKPQDVPMAQQAPAKPIDLTYHPPYHEETPTERYRRMDQEIKEAEKYKPPAGKSINDILREKVDSAINPLMRKLGIPKDLQGPIRDAAHAAVDKGITGVLDTALDQMKLDSTQKDAIRNTVKGILDSKPK